MNEDIYPWQLFTDGQAVETEGSAANPTEDNQNGQNEGQTSESGQNTDDTSDSAKDTGEGNDTASGSDSAAGNSTVSGNAAGNSTVSGNNAAQEKEDDAAGGMPQEEPPYGENRPEPLRGSTEEEYLSHISADIYGDAGVQKAAEYPFATVDESYFDDALFIGDSRTDTLKMYAGWENTTYYVKTGTNIWDIMDVVPDDEDRTIDEELQNKQFGKVYIMLGVNELGTGTAETYYQQFKKVVARIRELQPNALIFVESIIHVSAEKDAEGTVINNTEINARNKWLKKLADNKTIFYLDYNEVLDDENGALKADSTFDGVHLQADKIEPWKQFILSHGVK